MRKLLLAATLLAITAHAQTQALTIQLSVPERAGCDRVDNHVAGGIPLPQGAYKDVDKFVLLDAAGKPVPAQFVVRERWLKDDSVRFATVHFVISLKAHETAKFVVKDTGGPWTSDYAAFVKETEDGVKVHTGAVAFTVKKGEWHLFDSVDTVNIAGGPVLKAPGKVVFKAEYGKTPVEKDPAASKGNEYVAKPSPLGTPTDAIAVVKSLAIEEKGPGRVVLLVKGAFQEGGADKLDFQARYYAQAGSSAVRVVFTVINRQGKTWDEFVGLRALGFELPITGNQFALGASEGKDIVGTLAAGEKVLQLQPTSLGYQVSGKVDAKGKCRDLLTNRVGWISLGEQPVVATHPPQHAVTAAVRWFWQLHPKGLEATGDGKLRVWLVPYQEKKVEVPADECSEPLARVDLYTGGAKTHEMLFAFHGPFPFAVPDEADGRARAMGVIQPLFAACEPAWYCQKTLAFDKLCDARAENFRPEVRAIIRQYENTVDLSFATFMAYADGKGQPAFKTNSFFPITAKDKDGRVKDTGYVSAQKVEEFGLLNFGSHCEYKDNVTPNDALNSRWDGNYYDVPRACLVRFLRTGMWQYWDEAQASGLHLADIDICHWDPLNQQVNGIEHTCPNRGHFRQYWDKEPFGVSGNVDSAKSQSLYELYNLTGDGWYRDAALLSGDYLVVHGGSALRAQGNRITGLFMAWRSSRDEKYRKAWEDQAKKTAAGGIATGGVKAWDQFWMYGLGGEGLYNYFHATGDLDAAKAIQVAADSLIYCDVNKTMGKTQRGEYLNLGGFALPIVGYAYELTGDAKYLTYGLQRLAIAAEHSHNRSKTFAQHSRISPQFLYYLSADYKPPRPVVGDKKEADPAEPAIKEFAAAATATSQPGGN